MKTQYYKGTPEQLKSLLEEYLLIGYDAEIVDDELVVYHGKRPPKPKESKKANKAKAEAGQREHWSKRERNFGYARPS